MGQFEFKRARTAEKKSLRKELILTRANEMYISLGVREITMEDLAKKCEIAKGTLYLYFCTKEEVFTEIFLQKLEIFYSNVISRYIRPRFHLDSSPSGKRQRLELIAKHFSGHLESQVALHEELFELWSLVHSNLVPQLNEVKRSAFLARWQNLDRHFAAKLAGLFAIPASRAEVLAQHLAALVLGNSQLPHPHLAQGIFFLILGMAQDSLMFQLANSPFPSPAISVENPR